MIYLLALLIGVVAGLRTFTAPAAISLAAWSGKLVLVGTPFAFLASPWAAGILVLIAIGELIGDKLPSTPSRKVLVQFGARLVSGGFSGAVVGALGHLLVPGLVAGVLGAVLGTYVGAAVRAWLAGTIGRDVPAALIEDAVAIGGALVIVCAAGAV
jgi:uncharacterized membrane protein